MPSLVTSATSLNRGGVSRVNSFKREWADEDVKQQPPSSSAHEIEWSPSPERLVNEPIGIDLDELDVFSVALVRITFIGFSLITDIVWPHSYIPSLDVLFKFTLCNPSLTPNGLSASSIGAITRVATLQEEAPSLGGRFYVTKKVMETGGNSRSSSTGSTGKKKSVIPTVSIKQKLILSSEQQKVLQLVVNDNKNIFFTGSAGTGKSVLLREIIKALQRKHAKSPDAVAVTASTGIAACNIGGVTLHSFGGVGLALEDAPTLVMKIKRNKKAASRWTRTKVLIIDEVSMVDGALFDKLNKIGQMMRKRPGTPFGGIQIIVTGDFFQLPPVTKGGAEPKFCFEAQTWNETVNLSVNLTKVFRQKDERFVDMLNEMRFGRLSTASITQFRALSRPLVYDDGIAATELFPLRQSVDSANKLRLDELNTEGWTYLATDGGAITDTIQRNKMLANFMAASELCLKIGAQVMLIKNVDETLVNGSMGKVIGFVHKHEYVVNEHGRWRENGLFEDIKGSELDEEKKEKMLESLRAKGHKEGNPLPVVRFSVPGGHSRDMLVEYDSFKTELPNGEVQVSRTQLPLILAWAMSIHKAQGQTLDRVKVNLSRVFEKGQAYVALSRATSLEGLEVVGFQADKVMAHRKVATWSRTLKSLD